ncbi:hypothetical protein Pmar_PMAR001200 [Perkinsus marinus ATCC 50983]|uniref:Uncharacterized protein n=1 Tax=Perkinsus marinus (strain ATCC 50983 / TXsc) TaxID=423536 RepID=C5KT52_PERM5|nr:hypothetical protein Pmar_PMAR001200 [Perkinsus marinus ATCC 50983]EER12402.1 hypothetical protein Pmar_PMAR001200 [Perkinsus marinus ATCC 50983]|eukprot:XP_002780607.1 hypothetical protein Pmar_PMAR001200 [Perkinsus marinus ATCC 50983]
MDVAALMLSRVLRGRAMQNEMLVGVSKRAALIEVLARIPVSLIEEGIVSSLIGSTVGATLDKLSKELAKSKVEISRNRECDKRKNE